jgi:hypothetical protein
MTPIVTVPRQSRVRETARKIRMYWRAGRVPPVKGMTLERTSCYATS